MENPLTACTVWKQHSLLIQSYSQVRRHGPESTLSGFYFPESKMAPVATSVMPDFRTRWLSCYATSLANVTFPEMSRSQWPSPGPLHVPLIWLWRFTSQQPPRTQWTHKGLAECKHSDMNYYTLSWHSKCILLLTNTSGPNLPSNSKEQSHFIDVSDG